MIRQIRRYTPALREFPALSHPSVLSSSHLPNRGRMESRVSRFAGAVSVVDPVRFFPAKTSSNKIKSRVARTAWLTQLVYQ